MRVKILRHGTRMSFVECLYVELMPATERLNGCKSLGACIVRICMSESAYIARRCALLRPCMVHLASHRAPCMAYRCGSYSVLMEHSCES